MNSVKTFDHDTMIRVWDTEQEILDVIHNVCIENNLRYSLFYGTLLGAVRHGGFIPWDDDIDIIMPREDYDRLCEIWNEKAPKGYLLQTYNTDPDIVNNFTKIRKDHTTYLQENYERSKEYHKGIFVDIFPADHVAPGMLRSRIQYVAFVVNLLYSRGYPSGNKGIIGFIESVLLNTKKENYFKRRIIAEKIMTHWNKKSAICFVAPCTLRSCKLYFSSDMFEKLEMRKFRDKEYLSIVDYDKELKVIYGDYMKLPPEEERVWHHHPLIIDFERNYEEIPLEER